MMGIKVIVFRDFINICWFVNFGKMFFMVY